MTSYPSPVTLHQKIVLIGAKGMLAQAVLAAVPDHYDVCCFDLPDFDMTNRGLVLSTLSDLCPDVVINCAAFTNVDGCESQKEMATRVNGTAVGHLAEAALAIDATLVQISTDYVFSGNGKTPLREDEPVGPQSAYGRSKLLGEQAIITSGLEKYFILRTSWLYGPGGNNFVETILRLAKERDQIGIVADQIGSPTYTGDLADAIFNLLKLVTSHTSHVTVPYGLYHFSNDGACSWYDFAVEIVKQARKNGEDLKVKKISPIGTEDYPLPAKRPAYSVFSKQKYQLATGAEIPSWQESLKRYLGKRVLDTDQI